MLTFADHVRSSGEVGVPRRLSVGALFVLLTFYSVLFRFLVTLGTDANWTGIICLAFAAVTVGQMLLFRGVRPRAASIVAGALTCPALLVGVVIDESLTQFTGWSPVANGLGDPLRFTAAMLTLSMVGMFLGYVFGGTIAGVFFVVRRIRTRSATRSEEGPVVGEPDSSRLMAFVEVAGKWINPWQPQAPLRGALAAFLLPVAFGSCISPFIWWVWPSEVIQVAAAIGVCFAIWSGNLQLRVYWPLALCSIGTVVAAWPAAAFMEIPQFRDVIGERPDVVRFSFRMLGFLAGLTTAAVAGWAQWLIYRRAEQRHLRVAYLLPFAAILLFLSWTSTNRLEAWALSPSQQLFGRIQANGGELAWNSLRGTALQWVMLQGEDLTDEDFSRLRPHLQKASAIDLRGRNFTDQSVSRLEGLHVTSLRLINTSITDQAFDGLSDMSASYVTLNISDVGNHGLQQLVALPSMQQRLQSLMLNRTKVSDAAMAQLAPCGFLSVLSVADCPISDDGLKLLAQAAPPLQQLFLVGTDISDAGLAHVAKLKTLTELRLGDTKVTRTGVQALQAKLPGCHVVWDSQN